jgi:cell filamentation protein
MSGRYQASGAEGEFEPGSNGSVLRNRVGIQSPDDMDELELRLLKETYEAVLLQDFPDRRLTVADLKAWHRLWLGNVYSWAGHERSVNLGKGGFQFATASLVPGLLQTFDRDVLARRTPCGPLAPEDLVNAIAVTHVELVLIHPFRDGNGRLARLLADVMAVQAGQEPLDYSSWEQHKPAYIGAIHAGLAGEYRPMGEFVARALADAGPASANAPA